MNPTGRLKEVTIQGAGEPDRAFGAERNSLCFSELILLIDELAEMRHPPEVVRFEGFRASSDTIRLLEYTRARRLSPRVRLSFSDLSVEAVEEISGETGAIIVIPIEGSIGRSGGDKPIRVAEHAASVGIDLEIETLLRPFDIRGLESLARFVKASGFRWWQVDFLGHPSRGGGLLRGREIARTFSFLNGLRKQMKTVIEIREAPSFIRFMEAKRARGHEQPGMIRVVTSRDTLFVSAAGEVTPGRALNLAVGDVRETEIDRIYTHSPLLIALRDPERLSGRCGSCELNAICGGSRARAWRVSRNLLAEDPGCYRARSSSTAISTAGLRADHT